MGFFHKLFGAGDAGDGRRLQEVDAATARQWHRSGDCLLIDVREDREFRAERIPGAHLAPLSRLERSLPLLPPGKKAIFLCQSGGRTRMQAGRLAACGLSEAYVLKGGLMSWKANGFPTEGG
jgi:rhodanese-related sulfurtransferase